MSHISVFILHLTLKLTKVVLLQGMGGLFVVLVSEAALDDSVLIGLNVNYVMRKQL